MKCLACGSPVEKTDQFCRKCFARLEPPSLWRRLVSFFQNLAKPGPGVFTVKKSITIKAVGKDGTPQEYHSLAEAPLEVQKALEQFESEAMNEQPGSVLAEKLDEAAKDPPAGFITRKSFSLYRVKDATGNEKVYHSLEEMPPEIRAALEKARGKKE
jgi:hypothetical protein